VFHGDEKALLAGRQKINESFQQNRNESNGGENVGSRDNHKCCLGGMLLSFVAVVA